MKASFLPGWKNPLAARASRQLRRLRRLQIVGSHSLPSFTESVSLAPWAQGFSARSYRIPIRQIAGFSCCVHIPLCRLCLRLLRRGINGMDNQ